MELSFGGIRATQEDDGGDNVLRLRVLLDE